MRRTASVYDIVLSLVVVLLLFIVFGCTPAQQSNFRDNTLPKVEKATEAVSTTAGTVAAVSAPTPIAPIAATLAAFAGALLTIERLVAGAIAARKPNPPPTAVAVANPLPAPGPIFTPNTAPISAKAFGG